ncbi:hypothetical protein D3C72_2576930 [compost metagenome]
MLYPLPIDVFHGFFQYHFGLADFAHDAKVGADKTAGPHAVYAVVGGLDQPEILLVDA